MKYTKQSAEFKSLKVKYFWQQKFKELGGLIALIFGPYYFDLLCFKMKFGMQYWFPEEGVGGFELIFCHWLSGAFTIFIIGLVAGLIFLIVIANLDKADKRASKELGIK